MSRVVGRAARVAALAVLLAGCAAGEVEGGPQPPRDGRAGIQLSGAFDGRQIAASDGSPDLLLERCVQRIGMEADVCFAGRSIDGTPFVVVFRNADIMEAGTTIAVGGQCRTAEECREVDDVAVIEVQVGQSRQRAVSGTLTIRDVLPGRYYSGNLVLRFPDGRLSGGFDVVPRPE